MKVRRAADAALTRRLVERANELVEDVCRASGKKRISLMEVCGTHTMAISSSGIRRAVDKRLRLLSGPGCPVCVTAQDDIDAAIGVAHEPGVVVATFGDMLRVPGTGGTLEQARAMGADVRVVYSASDVVLMAESEPSRWFVFLGVGFETTAPTVAAAVLEARRRRLSNFTVLPMFKLIPPALRFISGAEQVNVDGFILPGHVSVIIGSEPYRFLAEEFRKACCITGFEALDIVQGVVMLLGQMQGKPEVAMQYRRAVRPDGNPKAREVMNRVFIPNDAAWRGIGVIPGSGLGFRAAFRRFDGSERAAVSLGQRHKGQKRRRGQDEKISVMSRDACRCGDVMLGLIVPPECRLFGRRCTPEEPVGPCMVSSEGACAAYYKYER